jgi:hypothetical protein
MQGCRASSQSRCKTARQQRLLEIWLGCMSDLDLTIARDGKNSQIFQLYAAQRHEECLDVIEQVLADSGGAAV